MASVLINISAISVAKEIPVLPRLVKMTVAMYCILFQSVNRILMLGDW